MTPTELEQYPDYGCTEDGRVWSRKRGAWQPLALTPNGKWNYLKTKVIDRNGRTVTRKAHVLVAEAFLGPRPAGADVNHLDGDKRNNAAANLEYCSRSDNMSHAYKIGLISPPEHAPKPTESRPVQLRLRGLRRKQDPSTVRRGERITTAKIRERDVHAIRALAAEGVPIREIGRRYGISHTQAWSIARHRKWAHVSACTPAAPHP